MNCTFPSWLDSFIALYPREILTERGGVVDHCARLRIAGKFLIKASKRRTRSLTIPTTQHPYPILFYVCSYIQFPIWPVHYIFSKLYKANALEHSREWWGLLWNCVNGLLVNLELLALLLRALVIRYRLYFELNHAPEAPVCRPG